MEGCPVAIRTVRTTTKGCPTSRCGAKEGNPEQVPEISEGQVNLDLEAGVSTPADIINDILKDLKLAEGESACAARGHRSQGILWEGRLSQSPCETEN